MANEILDFVVLIYTLVVVCINISAAALYACYSNEQVLKARNVPMLVIMSLGACVHMISEVVGNRHITILIRLEAQACPVWGYWLPYFFGAGFFFSALYLRLFIYSSAISRNFTGNAARRALNLRGPIAFAILIPIGVICVLASFAMDASRPDSDGVCTSGPGYKIAVGAWVLGCILALVTSVVVFRRGFVSDFVGESSKQAFVACMGVVVLVAVAFVFIFADSGLDSSWNRSLATFSVTTLYAWALGIMGLKPLWKAMRGDVPYQRVLEDQVEKMRQPLESVVMVVESSQSKKVNRLIVADFLTYCNDPVRGPMDRGSKRETYPNDIVQFYVQMDAWTTRQLKALGIPDDDPNYIEYTEDLPPLVSEDIVRTVNSIIIRYFTNEGVPGFVNLHIPANVHIAVTKNHHMKGDPVDTFKDAMWWALSLLDDYYGEKYINTYIRGRPVYDAEGVKTVLEEIERAEARRRVEQAKLIPSKNGVVVDEDAGSDHSGESLTLEMGSTSTNRTNVPLESDDSDSEV